MAATLAISSPRPRSISRRRGNLATTPRSTSGTRDLLTELANAVELYCRETGSVSPQDVTNLTTLCRSVEVQAYNLRPNDALRALALLAGAARAQEERRGCRALGIQRPSYAQSRQTLADEQAAVTMRSCAQRVAASIAPRSLTAGPRFVADAIATLAATESARQEDLDALLSRLLVLLREQPRELTPMIIVRITSAIGQMRQQGGANGCNLCARDGVSDDIRVANQRCIVLLGSHIQRILADFLEEDLAVLHEVFAVTYLGYEDLGKILQRCAVLRAGLCVESVAHLDALGRLEAAIDLNSPALVDTLPDFTLGYCRQLAQMYQGTL